ncbi:uncharacterized protein BDV17DRAFT_268363 [Aspergillus undulatus]|uniref:uncharacterized protein n=1 Tax=Aspergillus undulatus TaxID=1810928 RepID=UPI003CCD9255
MEHLHSQLPYSQWRLQILRQLFLPSGSSNATFLSRRAYSTSNNRAQADPDTTIAKDNDDNTNGIDTAKSTIPLSQRLPQSPLITDPHPGRDLRHRKKRRPTSNDLADLSNNPWAMALASPIRMCNWTNSRLPKAFLTDWGLVEEPVAAAESSNGQNPSPEASVSQKANKDKGKDNKLWVLPVGLLKDDLVNPAHNAKGKRDGRSVTTANVKIRMIDRLPLLQHVTNATDNKRERRYSSVLMPVIPLRWKSPQGPMTGRDMDRMVWRGDMPDFVLGMKRRNALEMLKRVSDTFKSQKTWSKVWMSFDARKPHSETALLEGLITEGKARNRTIDRMETGAFIVFGNDSRNCSGANAGEATTLSELVTLPASGRKVPVFDLTRLFSQAELEELRAYHTRFRKFAAFLTPSNKVMANAILELWSLQGYAREPRQPYV